MTDIGDRDMDGEGAPVINGGLLDPRTFPMPWPPAPEPRSPDQDVRDEVERDILAAQAKLPPIGAQAGSDGADYGDGYDLQRPPAAITGPLRTDVPDDVVQGILNAQAGLPPVPPHPEAWSINGQPYLAISARTFDPTRSSGVTSMPTPAESAAAFAGRKRFAVPDGDVEAVGYIGHSPVSAVPVGGQARATDAATTVTYRAPAGSPRIHGHIDGGLYASEGMVDNTQEADGYGDTASFNASPPVPTATVSHGQVGWHVLDNGQLKFLYPPGSMDSLQIGLMQQNLNDEQRKFLRPK